MHTLEWFKKRVWTRIFRDKSTCTCSTCQDVNKNGLIIIDESHASYLDMYQEIYHYRDKK